MCIKQQPINPVQTLRFFFLSCSCGGYNANGFVTTECFAVCRTQFRLPIFCYDLIALLLGFMARTVFVVVVVAVASAIVSAAVSDYCGCC